MKIGLSIWIVSLSMVLGLTGAAVAESQRPVAVFGGKNDVKVVIHSSLLPPDAAYDIPYQDGGEWLEPKEFSKYAAVVVCYLPRSAQWSDPQLEQAKQYVHDGGHLILLSSTPYILCGKGRDLKRMEPLLGATYWGELKTAGTVLVPNDPLLNGTNPSDFQWALTGGALGKLTTARALAGTKEAATLAVNNYGKGQVVYINAQLFRVMANQVEGVTLRQVVTNAILAANPTKNPSKREAWIPKPLGPDVQPPAAEAAPARRPLTPTRKTLPADGQPVTLVRDAKPQAVIVIADQPTPAAREAAKVIQSSIQQMSGAELPILSEKKLNAHRNGNELQTAGNSAKSFILVGESKLAGEYGIDASKLPYEGFQIKTAGNVLLVVGRDTRENGQSLMGSRNAAYALLEQLGFRWLWPGELGTVVPHDKNVTIAPTNFTDAPALRQRRMRNSVAMGPEKFAPAMLSADESRTAESVKLASPRYQAALDTLGFSAATFLKQYHNSGNWFAEMALGSSYELRYTHAYGKMYERFGKSHPQWFALQPDGTRKQFPSRERLCVSNEQLIQQIAADKIAELKADPLLDCASISPNDGGAHNSFCMCENCRKLDPVNGPLVNMIYEIGPVRQYLKYPSLSDRMVTFYSRIGQIVAKALPDRMVGAYAYSTYRSPPLEAKLAPNVLIGFVGLNYFNEPQRQSDLQRWDAWSRVAHQIFLRPNALLGANGIPANFAHKIGSDIKHCYQSGMIATDFDSVLHHWSSRGLNTYVLAQLLWDPSRNVDSIIDDYCSKGFGPASKSIRAYFDDLEKLTDRIASSHSASGEKELRDEEQDWAPVRGGYEVKFFTPQATAQLKSHLDQARQDAAGDKTILARIDFLEIGLRYADFEYALYNPALLKTPENGQQLMNERYAFYKDVFENHPYALNVVSATWNEGPYLIRAFKWKHPAK